MNGLQLGALHPNIQDSQGRPKRDPQTILQILNDLLSATNQYQVSIFLLLCYLLIWLHLSNLILTLHISIQFP